MSEEATGILPPTDETQLLADRIETQRKKIFKAMSIIEACRMGSDSMLAPMHGDDDEDAEPDFADALAAAHDLLDDVAGELETILAPPVSTAAAR